MRSFLSDLAEAVAHGLRRREIREPFSQVDGSGSFGNARHPGDDRFCEQFDFSGKFRHNVSSYKSRLRTFLAFSFDELAAWFDFVTHEDRENAVSFGSIFQFDFEHRPVFRVVVVSHNCSGFI